MDGDRLLIPSYDIRHGGQKLLPKFQIADYTSIKSVAHHSQTFRVHKNLFANVMCDSGPRTTAYQDCPDLPYDAE